MRPFYLPYGIGTDRLNGYAEKDHEELAERLKKTLYYGKTPTTDRPSLPLTEIAVECLQDAAPRELGRLTHLQAATMSRQACMSPCSMMMGMLYVKRLRHGNTTYLQQISSSDLFLISMMMASKFLYDEGVDDEVFNDEWAAAADMETEDVNELERNFLSAIDWQLFIKEHEFMDVLHQMEKRIALQQGVDRGWFTYTDLWVLSHDPHLFELWRRVGTELTKVVVVSSAAYLASVLTMVGSTMALTALSMALGSVGPSVAPQQIPQLSPAISAPDHVESPKNVSEPTKTCQENCQTSLSLNGLLTHLLAVVTLPETLVHYVYGTRNKNSSQDSFPHWKIPQQSICANGPCPFNSNKKCRNVTSGPSSSFPSVWESYTSSSKHNCENDRSDNGGKREHCACDKNLVPSLLWNHVKCCCSNKGTEFLSPDGRWSLHDRFSDISLGFSTGPQLPVLVQT